MTKYLLPVLMLTCGMAQAQGVRATIVNTPDNVNGWADVERLIATTKYDDKHDDKPDVKKAKELVEQFDKLKGTNKGLIVSAVWQDPLTIAKLEAKVEKLNKDYDAAKKDGSKARMAKIDADLQTAEFALKWEKKKAKVTDHAERLAKTIIVLEQELDRGAWGLNAMSRDDKNKLKAEVKKLREQLDKIEDK